MKVEGALGVKPPGPDFLLVLPFVVPSQNEQNKWHYMKRAKFNKYLGWHLYSVMGRDEIAHRDRLAHVTIRVCSNASKAMGGRCRRLDDDNLIAGHKGLRDQLKHLGIIKNDSPAWLDCGYIENRDPVDRPRTEIEITYNANRPGIPGRK